MHNLKLSSRVRDSLRYYVYAYLDPRNDKPFYIGKGRGGRILSHLRGGEPRKARILRELKRLGLKPRIDVLRYGLTEKEALLVEATAIDLLGVPQLTNRVRGHGTRDGSRARIEEIVARLNAKSAKIRDAVVLIVINKQYREGLTREQLYDATRAAWVVNPSRHPAQFALSVFRGVVREVYEIERWLPGGSTMRTTEDSGRPRRERGRWEFVGRLAEERIRRRYLGRSVADYFKPGAANPIQYVNC